jgi:hypothetical protein
MTAAAAAWIVLGATTLFLFQTERQADERGAALGAFDSGARTTTAALADLRITLQAYVAAGQGVNLWMGRAATLMEQAASSIDSLRATATSLSARSALMEAGANLPEINRLDREARSYVQSGQTLMASDILFTDASEAIDKTSELIEAARAAEHVASADDRKSRRNDQATMLAASVGIAGLAAALLALAPGARQPGPLEAAAERAGKTPGQQYSLEKTTSDLDLLPLRFAHHAREAVPALKTAAELCTEFSCVRDAQDVTRLLTKAATVLDASGIVVWIANAEGTDLEPVLAHGYPPQALARMPSVPRSADNAAATAYRKGTLQIVLARPGLSAGAIVAPLLSPQGCIGAFSAEFRGGSETSDGAQALAAIFAAQLSGVLSPASIASSSESRIASA